MSEYGWSVSGTIEHTQYQLKYLGRSILRRIGKRDQRLMNIFRVSQHAKKSQYSSYFNSLEPKIQDNGAEESLIALPPGVNYNKE